MAICSGDFSRNTDQMVNFDTKNCGTFQEQLEGSSCTPSEIVLPVCINYSSQSILDSSAQESFEVAAQKSKGSFSAPGHDVSCQTASYPGTVWALLQCDSSVPTSTCRETLPAPLATAVACCSCGGLQERVDCHLVRSVDVRQPTISTSACRTEHRAPVVRSSASTLLLNSAMTSRLSDTSPNDCGRLPHSHSDSALNQSMQCHEDSAHSASVTRRQNNSCARPCNGDGTVKTCTSLMSSFRGNSDDSIPSVMSDNCLVTDPGSSNEKDSKTPIDCVDFTSYCKLPHDVETDQGFDRCQLCDMQASRGIVEELNSCFSVDLKVKTVDVDTQTSQTQFLEPYSLKCRQIVPQVCPPFSLHVLDCLCVLFGSMNILQTFGLFLYHVL